MTSGVSPQCRDSRANHRKWPQSTATDLGLHRATTAKQRKGPQTAAELVLRARNTLASIVSDDLTRGRTLSVRLPLRLAADRHRLRVTVNVRDDGRLQSGVTDRDREWLPHLTSRRFVVQDAPSSSTNPSAPSTHEYPVWRPLPHAPTLPHVVPSPTGRSTRSR
jgi:hypothetical protein